jgi:glyoxylase-like metal-dependent hydrolase (beta-lactamase superfamily II)
MIHVKTLSSHFVSFTAVLFSVVNASAQESETPGLIRVSQSVSALLDPIAGANSAVIVTGRDVLVVDSHVAPSVAMQTIGMIRSLTNLPVSYLINTHWHVDHSNGNSAFRSEYPHVEIVAHSKTLETIPQRGPEQLGMWPDFLASNNPNPGSFLQGIIEEVSVFDPELPSMTVDDELVLDRGSVTVEVVHPGQGHTDGDLVIVLPEEGVLISGDLLLGFTDFPLQYATTLRNVLDLSFEIVVPGHGPVDRNPRPRLQQMAEEMELIAETVRTLRVDGASVESVVEHVAGLSLPGLIQRRDYVVETLYAQLDELEVGVDR